MARRTLALTTAFVAALLLVTGCFTGAGSEPLDGFELSLPGAAAEGELVALTVTAVGSRGSSPLRTFEGEVRLSVSGGRVVPDVVDVSAGVGSTEVLFRGERTEVIVTAAFGSSIGSAGISVAALEQLPGADGDAATSHVPTIMFAPREGDYTDTHPDLPGAFLSYNTLLVAFAANAAVAEVNAALAAVDAEVVGAVPGVPGEVGSILFLRVPAQGHAEMTSALDALRTQPAVDHAVQDSLLEHPGSSPESPSATQQEVRPASIPAGNGGDPAGWTWEVEPAGGNWGMEMIRAPQLWNLHAALTKAGASVVTGVLDVGFAADHPDLAYVNLTPGHEDDHGTHVAGIVGGGFDNGVGVDGVNPFAAMVVGRYGAIAETSGGFAFTSVGARESWGLAMSDGLFGLIEAAPGVRVVNVSLGYNWGKIPVDTDDTFSIAGARARYIASEQGAIVATRMAREAWNGPLPLIVAAAGNDSNDVADGAGGFVVQDARYGSPFANAALQHGVANILVVESVAHALGGALDTTRSSFSNKGGHVSAPGSSILSASHPTPYERKSGTSMAAPHVTGSIGYLVALDPSLTHAEIRDLLVSTGVPAGGGASDRVDAFAAAMAIDGVRGSDHVLRMLVDIDDGTADGNRRVEFDAAVDFLDEDADLDGGVGDGAIDMADFRRWRDWLLQVEGASELRLDGSLSHPKKDVNGDGAVTPAPDENVYPRGDFNGDGRLSRVDTRPVPGVLGGEAVTDLEVLQARFDDPHYDVADLPFLIDSADVTVDLSACFEQTDIAGVRSSIWGFIDESFVDERLHEPAEAEFVHTVPVNDAGYEVRVEGLDADGEVVSIESEAHPFELGSDVYWRPSCGVIDIDVTFPATVEPEASVPLVVRVGVATATETEYQAGWQVDLEVQGGTAAQGGGLTDADGFFDTEIQVSAAAETVTVFVTVTDPVTARSATETAQATVGEVEAPGVSLLERDAWLLAAVRFSVYEPYQTGTRSVLAFDEARVEELREHEGFADLDTTFDLQQADTLRGATASSSAHVSRNLSVDIANGEFRGVEYQATFAGDVEMTSQPDEDQASVRSFVGDDNCFYFEVVGSPASFALAAQWTVAPGFSDWAGFVSLDGGDVDLELELASGASIAESGTLAPRTYDLCFDFEITAEVLVNATYPDFWPDAYEGSFELTFDVGP